MWLIDYCQTHDKEVVSVVSESFPHLKRGAIRDFINIMEENNEPKIDEEIGEKKIEDWFKKKFSGECCKDDKCKTSKKSGLNQTGAGVYCLGVIGAAVYYIGTAATFWIGVLGVLKAFVWPAFLVHGLLKFLGL
ncbi:hypothetical protein KKI23_03355 [Patescibacteria group bacterium]|nr:hypothetical protein [Patescibacteria group bacterium]